MAIGKKSQFLFRSITLPIMLFCGIYLTQCDGYMDASEIEEEVKMGEETIRIVTFGHVYNMMTPHRDIFSLLVDSTIGADADYVFVLGDLVRFNHQPEWDFVLPELKRVGVPVYFAPGNHDVNFMNDRSRDIADTEPQAKQLYLDNIGYMYHFFADENANYIFINSNEKLETITNFLDQALPHVDTTKPTLLLSHHALWSYKIRTDDPRTWTLKQFQFEDIYPWLGNVDYIFGGDFITEFTKLIHEGYPCAHVGNYKIGADVWFTIIEITPEGEVTYEPHEVIIPANNKWFDE